MSPLAFYRDLVANGVPDAVAYEMAEKFEAERDAELRERMGELLDRLAVDVKAEGRKAKDRARKAAAKAKTADVDGVIPRNSSESVEIAEFQTQPLSLPPSPQTPLPPTHTRECITTRERAREDAGFAQFWATYPRKTCKADARKAFSRAWKKLPPHDEDAILCGGLERAKAGWSDAQFIPHAATWLNGERWNDEPTNITQLRPHERPHPDDKLTRKQANLARAFAGSERAAGLRGEP